METSGDRTKGKDYSWIQIVGSILGPPDKTDYWSKTTCYEIVATNACKGTTVSPDLTTLKVDTLNHECTPCLTPSIGVGRHRNDFASPDPIDRGSLKPTDQNLARPKATMVEQTIERIRSPMPHQYGQLMPTVGAVCGESRIEAQDGPKKNSGHTRNLSWNIVIAIQNAKKMYPKHSKSNINGSIVQAYNGQNETRNYLLYGLI